MSQIKIKPTAHYFFPLYGILIALIFLALVLYFWPSIRDFLQEPSKIAMFWFLLVFFIGSYSLYYLFHISVLRIAENKLMVPSLNYRGYPEWFSFRKSTIDINSITKIIVYPQKYDARFLFWEYGPTTLPDAKIVILAENKMNVAISNNYYGEEQIQKLIAVLCNSNEDIQIIESGKS